MHMMIPVVMRCNICLVKDMLSLPFSLPPAKPGNFILRKRGFAFWKEHSTFHIHPLLISVKGTLSVNNAVRCRLPEPCSPVGEIPAVFAQSDFPVDDEGRGHYGGWIIP